MRQQQDRPATKFQMFSFMQPPDFLQLIIAQQLLEEERPSRLSIIRMPTTMGYYCGQKLRFLFVSWVILILHVRAKESIPSDRSDQQSNDYFVGYETEPYYAKRRHEPRRPPPKSEKVVKSVKKKEDKLLKFLKGTSPSVSNIFSVDPTNKRENEPKTQKGHSSGLNSSDAYIKRQKTESSATKMDASQQHAPKKISSKDEKEELATRRKKQHSKKSDRPKREKLGDTSSKAQKSKQRSPKKMKQPKGPSPTRSPTRADDENSDDDDDTLAYDDEEVSCHSKAAKNVLDVVQDAIVQNPSSCCDHTGTIAAYVTHSDPTTSFWQTAYATILSLSEAASTCFIFSGINASSPTLHQTLLDVTMTVSTLPEVATLMVVDATTTTLLVTALRHMQQQQHLLAPLVGVWHSGYDNILLESITSGFATLPYVGVASSDLEAAFGTAAAPLFPSAGNTTTALCAMASDTTSSSECAHWFAAAGGARRPVTAICNDDNFTIPTGVDIVWATTGCCERALLATTTTTDVLVGCHHDDRGAAAAYAVLRQPVTFQATMAAAWSNAAIAASARGGSGRFAFPAVGTLVATELEPVLSLR